MTNKQLLESIQEELKGMTKKQIIEWCRDNEIYSVTSRYTKQEMINTIIFIYHDDYPNLKIHFGE